MHSTRERGFTLIEMLVVISIIMILVGVVLFNTRSYSSTTALERSASDLAALIRSARQKSIVVEQHGIYYPSYGVYLQTGSSPIIYADCLADDNADGTLSSADTFRYLNGNCGGNATVETLTLTGGVRITDIMHNPGATHPGDVSIQFVRPIPSIFMVRSNGGGETQLRTGTVSVELTGTDGDTRTVSVNSSGNIRIQY